MQDPFACLVATVTLLCYPLLVTVIWIHCTFIVLLLQPALQREQADLREEISSTVLFSLTVMDCVTLDMEMSRSCGMSNFYSWVVWKRCVEKFSPGHASKAFFSALTFFFLQSV